MNTAFQGVILFVSGTCAIVGCFFIIHVAARAAGEGQRITGAHALTGLFVGWFFLTIAWCMAVYGGLWA